MEQEEIDRRKPMDKNRERCTEYRPGFKHCLGLCKQRAGRGRNSHSPSYCSSSETSTRPQIKKPASFPYIWAENNSWHQLACQALKAAAQDVCIQGINLAAWWENRRQRRKSERNPVPDISIARGWHIIFYFSTFFVEEKPSVSLCDSLILP